MRGIGERIALCMKKQSMTEDELAKKADIGVMTLKRYLMGYNDPTKEDAEKLGAALGVSADYILGQFEITAFAEPVVNVPIHRENVKPRGRNARETLAVSVELACEREKVEEMRECFFIIIGDDDMCAAKLTTGDKVLINPKGTVVSGDIAAVRIDGGKILIRRVYFDGYKILIKTEGPRIECAEYDTREGNVEVLGSVVFMISYPV